MRPTLDTTPADLASRVSLAGRTALVTGASRGIGAAVARRLDASGARVALSARDEVGLKQVASELVHDPVVLPADLALADAAGALAAGAVEALDGVDVLVNNAGAALGVGPSSLLSTSTIAELFGLNVGAALVLSGALAEQMAERGGGSIITVGSAVSTSGTPYTALYTATKSALDGMTRALAAEWGPAGVRVNIVRPGIVATDMGAFITADPALDAYYRGLVPLRRVCQPDDVADLVAFLVSPAASYITATDVAIDGGWGQTHSVLPPAPANIEAAS